MKLHIFVFFLFLGLSSCISNTEENSFNSRPIQFTDFKNKYNIKLKKFSTNLSENRLLEISIIDTVMVAIDSYTNPQINFIGLNSQKKIGSVLFRGQDTGEAIQCISIIPTDNKSVFWAYDMTLGKLIEINLLDALNKKNYVPSKEVLIPTSIHPARSVAWLNDSTFICTSLKMSDCRLIKFNHKSNVTLRIGQLPVLDKSWPELKENVVSYIYNSFVVSNPKYRSYTLGYFNTDILEFYSDDSLLNRLSGPINFNPTQEFVLSPQDFYVPNKTKESKTAYTNLKMLNDDTYCLFSGEDDFQTCGKHVFTFTKDGQAKNLINLDRYVYSIALNKNKNNSYSIYTLDKNSEEIYYATFNQ